jgi:hypothetical protein
VITVFCSWQINEPLRLAAFYRNILAALAACGPNLLHLEISFYLDLTRCRFPLLQWFSIAPNVPFTAAMSSFLQHHPTLQTLELKSSIIGHRAAIPIQFPHILRFAGSNWVIDALTFGSFVQDIYIRRENGEIETALDALAPSAVSVRCFRSAHIRLPPRFLDRLPRILPRITTLSIGHHDPSPNVSTKSRKTTSST